MSRPYKQIEAERAEEEEEEQKTEKTEEEERKGEVLNGIQLPYKDSGCEVNCKEDDACRAHLLLFFIQTFSLIYSGSAELPLTRQQVICFVIAIVFVRI